VTEVSRSKRGAELDLKINRVPFGRWLSSKGTRERGRHVLDVAMRPINPAQPTSHLVDGNTSIPVRLAINSETLRLELKKITNQCIDNISNVLLPPWKALVTYHDAIKERFQTLKKLQCDRDSNRHGEEKGRQAEGGVPEDAVKGSPPDQNGGPRDFSQGGGMVDISKPCEVCGVAYPPHDTPLECLDIKVSHFSCLVDFLDNDLKQTFDLRRELAAGTTHEIAFDDLWHLFNPGDVIATSDLSQAFRVFHTSGGRACLSEPAHTVFEKTPVVNPFRIDCFYIDFDLKYLGPVHETIMISEYAGARPITSLAVFPIRFLEKPEDFTAGLIKRGKRLRELTPFSHRRYQANSTDDIHGTYVRKLLSPCAKITISRGHVKGEKYPADFTLS
jgi:hypothetical protein